MGSLQTEWARLYQLPESLAQADSVRALVLELGRPTDWAALSTLWRGVQTDLEWPAPAIAVNGVDGHQLWFSLAEPVPFADAEALLTGLRNRYLGALADARIRLFPSADGPGPRPIPALQDNGRWSAFVAPDLAAIFADEPWLDLPPSPEAQAQVLSGIRCIPPADFWAAIDPLHPAPAQQPPVAVPVSPATALPGTQAQVLAQQFLLSVMNDASVPLPQRIEAAKALLPYSAA